MSSPSHTAASTTADVVARASEAVREIGELRSKLVGLTPPTFGMLSPRYWRTRALRRRLHRASKALDELRTVLEKIGTEPDLVLRPRGAVPGVFARATGKPITIFVVAGSDWDAARSSLVAVVRFTSSKHRIVVLDEDSSDDRMATFVRGLVRKHPQVSLLRRGESFGTTRLINSLLPECPGDVVVIRAGARVSPGWLNALRGVAHHEPTYACVSPLVGADEGLGRAVVAKVLETLTSDEVIGATLVHGACVYFRKDALLALGGFDSAIFDDVSAAFMDFGLRARCASWQTVISSRVCVSQSANSDEPLAERHVVKLAELHSSFQSEWDGWVADNPHRMLSDALLERRRPKDDASPVALANVDARPVLMLVVFAGGGGTPKTNLDLARAMGAAWQVLVLTMSADEWTLVEVSSAGANLLEGVSFSSLSGLGEPLCSEHVVMLRDWIAKWQVAVVHFRHWLGTAPEIVTVARESGAKVIVSLHDFYAVCPALSLVDASSQCCFGDCTAHVISEDRDCAAIESWPGQAANVRLRGDFVHSWRDRVQSAIAGAEAIVTTNRSAVEIIRRTQPEIAARITIIEHGRDFAEESAAGIAGFSPTRLVFLGEATFVKGADFVVELARQAMARGLPLEFHLVGKAFVEVPSLPNLIAHGAYERDSLQSTLAAIQPTLILLPSRFPETYCHTLTEAWSCGVPVLAHGLGALAERIDVHGGGWHLDQLDVDLWLTRLTAIAGDECAWRERRDQALARPYRSVAEMTSDYVRLYEGMLGRQHEGA